MENSSTAIVADERKKVRKQVMVSAALIALLLLVLIPLASSNPDGLERVAGDLSAGEGQPVWGGLLPGYGFPVGNAWLGTFLAGMIGVLIVFVAMFLVAKLIMLRRISR